MTDTTWLKNALHLAPAKWPVGRSLRISIGIGVPLAIGFHTGHELIFMWITIAVMLQSTGEGGGSYRSLFRITTISSAIGSLGFLTGYLWFLPAPFAVAILTALAFIAGIVNSYGAAYSKGTLQAFIAASVSYGLAPDIHSAIPFWQASCLYLVGTAFYALMLGTEALIDKRRPQRQQLSDYLVALSALAATRATNSHSEPHNTAVEAQRRVAIDKYKALYDTLLSSRSANETRSKENRINADILQSGDAVFSSILANDSNEHLSAAADWLQTAAQAVLHHHALPDCPASLLSGSRLGERIIDLTESMAAAGRLRDKASHRMPSTTDASPARNKRPALKLDHLIVGPEVRKVAAKLALCMGLAFSAQFVVHDNHWYWIPLTVSLVMKPELGSVFVRAVLRTIGTSIGVVIGTLILMIVPKGTFLLLVLVALASCMPWAMQRSYALLSLLITPLVLILVDLVTPGTATINYAGQRLTDTIIGGSIVLVFGYFLWPRTHGKQLSDAYSSAMKSLADYFFMACSADPASSGSVRLDVYSRLSDLRTQLQKQLSEPPPVDREAAQWFPLVVAAERLADRITVYIENLQPDTPPPDPTRVESLTAHMGAIISDHHLLTGKESTSDNPFLDAIVDDLNAISRQLEAVITPLPHSPGMTAGR